MTDRERMQELIDFYCDADAKTRSNRSEEELAAHSPTIGEVLETMMGDVA